MKTRILALASVIAAVLAAPVSAACYADYKAKRDAPYGLHYGVMELRGACDPSGAADEISARLASDGWQLLTVVSVFDDAGLDAKRDSAGQYFLRY